MIVRTLSLVAAFVVAAGVAMADPLPSWNETESRARIIEFVESVTDPASADFVPRADRIAVFDNDGTLWGEQPVYFQLIFAIDQLKVMAEKDPSILSSNALKAGAAGDLRALLEGGHDGLLEVIGATHGGISVADFQAEVKAWLETARHPTTGLRFDQMTYQPMVELLRYLRDEGFATYIVSGGGLDFMRVFTDEAYGIPNNQVLGTYTKASYELVDGVPTIMKEPAVAFLDDKEGKPINISRVIGKRPIFAAGNSDGDFAMLQWTTAGDGPRFGMLIHHTDGVREVAYGCDSPIGRLCEGLEKGPGLGWLIVDMAKDWGRIYTGER